MRSTFLFTVAVLVFSTCARVIVITVGGNSGVFAPNSLTANQGDVVVFNFTQGNHTATQSTFASPCIPAHITDSTVNGFDSSFRDTHNGTAPTQLSVTITDNRTIWYYDQNTCVLQGVGGININKSSNETLDGFERNAARLNGTSSSSSSISGSGSLTGSVSVTPTLASSTPSTTASSTANRAAAFGLSGLIPAFATLFFFAL